MDFKQIAREHGKHIIKFDDGRLLAMTDEELDHLRSTGEVSCQAAVVSEDTTQRQAEAAKPKAEKATGRAARPKAE